MTAAAAPAAVIFDLDDTLYLERDVTAATFAHVAGELAARGATGGDAEAIAAALLELHDEDRDGVLDRYCARCDLPADWVPSLVQRYRDHRPPVTLPAATITVLADLRARGLRLGCVTDGPAGLQRWKVDSMGLADHVDAVVVADELGRAAWKPAPDGILACCAALGVDPADIVIVGDNPERDVAVAAALGVRCIRVRRPGAYFRFHDAAGIDHADVVEVTELEDVAAWL